MHSLHLERFAQSDSGSANDVAHCETRLTEGDSPGAIAVLPDLGFGVAETSWRGDLNFDAVPDLVLKFPMACGNWGECPYGVYAGCGGDSFRIVWGVDYVVGLEVGPVSDGRDEQVGWRELILIQRGAEEMALSKRLEFDGRRYYPSE